MKIRCTKCNDIIEGDKKGTYIQCKCGAIAIDETEYYWRIIGNYGDFEEIKEGLENEEREFREDTSKDNRNIRE